MRSTATAPEDVANPPGLVVCLGARPGPAHPLSDEVSALSSALAPHLPATPACVALWRLPQLVALASYHAVRAAGLVPLMLNDRWNDADVAAALSVVPATLIMRGDAPCLEGAHVAGSERQHECVSSAPNVFVRREQQHTSSPSYTVSSASTASQNGSSDGSADGPVSYQLPFRADEPLPAVVFFTSGTTAKPKAVPLSDAQLCLQSAAKRDTLALSAETRYLHLGPLFHVGGFSSTHATTAVGGTHVFLSDEPAHLGRALSAQRVLRAARDARVTFVSAVPAALRLLLDASASGDGTRLQLDSVRVVLYGGGPLAPAGGTGDERDANGTTRATASAVCAVLDELRGLFPCADVVGAYGMTETASSMTFLRHDELPRSSALHGSAGWPAMGHGVEVRVRGSRVVGGGDGMGSGDIGEIETRGPHLMRGYVGTTVGRGGANEDAARTRWWPTGDIGRMDAASGALFVLGRVHDVIRSGGEKVIAAEVEAALVGASGVRDAAVVGVPHRVLGEAVAAAIVLGEDDGLADAGNEVVSAVVAHACAGLARYKRPRWVFAERSLPRNASGKVVKRELRARLQRRIVVATPTAKL